MRRRIFTGRDFLRIFFFRKRSPYNFHMKRFTSFFQEEISLQLFFSHEEISLESFSSGRDLLTSGEVEAMCFAGTRSASLRFSKSLRVDFHFFNINQVWMDEYKQY